MWSPAVTAVRTKGIPCTFQPLKEGYRSWASGFCMSKGVTPKQADMIYEFINWYLSGWAGAYLNRQGYYSAVLPTAKAQMEPYEWAYWMEGKPAEKDIKGPDGSLLEKAGATSPAGTRSWTKMITWSANGMSSSPPSDRLRPISAFAAPRAMMALRSSLANRERRIAVDIGSDE
jgi:spermidine/putrescine-binding protein